MEEQREVKAEERWGQSIRLRHGDPAKGLWPGDIDIEKKEVLQLHAEIWESFRMSVEKAIRIGELLTSIKQRIGHGQWGSWVEENLSFSQRSAERYMALTAIRIKIDSVSDLSLFDAYKLLPHKLQHDSKVKPGTMLRLTKDGYVPEEELEPESETPGAIEIPEPEIVEAKESDESDEMVPDVKPDEAVQTVESESVLRGIKSSDMSATVKNLCRIFDAAKEEDQLSFLQCPVQSATVKKLSRIFDAASEEDRLSFLDWAEINYEELSYQASKVVAD